MTTPETIYLIPGEYEGENCLVWCDCAAPDSYCDPDDAVKYLRFDVHDSIIDQQSRYAKTGMDAARKSAIWLEENAKRLLAESNPAAIESERSANAELTEEIGHLEDRVISQGQQLREIVNITKGVPVDKMHSTHDAVESVERLQARVAMLELESSDVVMCLSELMRGLEIPAGPMFNDPVSMNMIGKAIAAQAKEAAKAGGDL